MQSKNMTSMQLVRRGITEGETKWKKATFDKDWIINLVVNDLHEDQSVPIPWLRLANNAGLIADWILNPNILGVYTCWLGLGMALACTSRNKCAKVVPK